MSKVRDFATNIFLLEIGGAIHECQFFGFDFKDKKICWSRHAFLDFQAKVKATTNSAHDLPVAPNLLDQKFSVDGPGKVWGTDITYIPTEEG